MRGNSANTTCSYGGVVTARIAVTKIRLPASLRRLRSGEDLMRPDSPSLRDISALAWILRIASRTDNFETDMLDRIDQQLGTLRNVANLRAYRQEVLASNIANADTPNYKARDFDFSAALESAQAGRAGFAITRTSPRHLGGNNASDAANAPAGVDLRYRTEYQANVDGNTVNMDVERGAFAENSVQLEAALTFVREEFKRLQTAIQGQ